MFSTIWLVGRDLHFHSTWNINKNKKIEKNERNQNETKEGEEDRNKKKIE